MSDYETARCKFGIAINEILLSKGYDVPEVVLGDYARAAMQALRALPKRITQRQIDFILRWCDNLPNEAEVAIARQHLHDIDFKMSDLGE